MEPKYQVLKQYFGYDSFRGGQEPLIDAQLAGRDVFGVMPTGGGKSLCYQIPALLLPGITLVISPLISLMQDQVLALRSAGIPAVCINSALNGEQMREIYRNMMRGVYKIIYVAPERLPAEGFSALARQLQISAVAVDEAHCISQWGQDFRPSYLRIVDFLESLPRRPVVSAFTATATPKVQEDIIRLLKLRNPFRLITGFDRPNLRFEIHTPESKKADLLSLLALRKGKSGIVYCSTRKNVEEVCLLLQSKRLSVTRYHAGLDDEERQRNQEDFLFDRKTIMVATNAFGMGIDKSNVSFVIHYNMPQSLESYYQEAGRAGRDGQPAECILLFSRQDIHMAVFLIQHSHEEGELTEELRARLIDQDMARLYQMIGYCETGTCLRGYILNYFGQPQKEKQCGNCGNCKKAAPKPKKATQAPPPPKFVTRDITREAQMVLSCIRRISTAFGHSSTITMTVRVLRGSRDKRILESGLEELSTYNLMNAWSREELREIIAHLQAQGLVQIDSKEIIELTDTAKQVLFYGQKVTVTLEESEMESRFPHSGLVGTDSRLLTALKQLRLQLATQEGIPAFTIFTNATLADMAEKLPQTPEEFREVSGVGRIKAERYGKAFLEVLRKEGRKK